MKRSHPTSFRRVLRRALEGLPNQSSDDSNERQNRRGVGDIRKQIAIQTG